MTNYRSHIVESNQFVLYCMAEHRVRPILKSSADHCRRTHSCLHEMGRCMGICHDPSLHDASLHHGEGGRKCLGRKRIELYLKWRAFCSFERNEMMDGIGSTHRGEFRLLAHSYKRRRRDPCHSLTVCFCHGSALEDSGACLREDAGCRRSVIPCWALLVIVGRNEYDYFKHNDGTPIVTFKSSAVVYIQGSDTYVTEKKSKESASQTVEWLPMTMKNPPNYNATSV